MADQDHKKTRKCGNCGQEGHDKRKCPKVEVKPEIKAEPQTIYTLTFKEDNGDSVHDYVTLYASVDGLVRGIEETIVETRERLCQDDDEDEPDNTVVPSHYRPLFYYTDQETLKNAPIPTKEYVESVLNAGFEREHLEGLIIKVCRELGGAACFACEISVHKKTLNP